MFHTKRRSSTIYQKSLILRIFVLIYRNQYEKSSKADDGDRTRDLWLSQSTRYKTNAFDGVLTTWPHRLSSPVQTCCLHIVLTIIWWNHFPPKFVSYISGDYNLVSYLLLDRTLHMLSMKSQYASLFCFRVLLIQEAHLLLLKSPQYDSWSKLL